MPLNGPRAPQDSRSHDDAVNTRGRRLEENTFRANKRSTDVHSTSRGSVEVTTSEVLCLLKYKCAQECR